jgi:hypothetical protein
MTEIAYPIPFRGVIGSPWHNAKDERPIYNCPAYIEWRDNQTRRLKRQFIADARGYTPAQAASRAAVIANCLAAYLNSYTTNGQLRYDAHVFAETFEIPTDLKLGALVDLCQLNGVGE